MWPAGSFCFGKAQCGDPTEVQIMTDYLVFFCSRIGHFPPKTGFLETLE
jgi:hypothetical protein